MIEVVPGPHGGYWVKNGGRVVLWAYSMELAERRRKEMEDQCPKPRG